ncbi:Lrp/AsnC family transcriptional regulator [Flavisphingomonas formosensis]|uniref:Lrp/AsnC family transcriptional regulator n=1 Tax=Flavisphingomonas formosensis TaxID=861534 RepID=UPI0012F993F8|nr:Lrp/AsnC family transcriptional regulator [Sphingomonas formosensis]
MTIETEPPNYAFDGIDRRIAAMLTENGRMTNNDIARQLGVSRAMISARIGRMTNAGALRIVAATDFSAHGFDLLLSIGIRVSGRSVEEVADDLIALPEVLAAHIVTGPFEIQTLIGLKSPSELSGRIIDLFAQIEGIGGFDVSVIADIVKYQFEEVCR